MKRLIDGCIRRPVTVVCGLIALALSAALSGASLPLTRLPELGLSRIIVETAYPGMSAEEVRALVTIPVEDALAPVKGLERSRSVSRAGVSIITLDFRWGTDTAAQAVLVREAVDIAYAQLPGGAEKPRVSIASAEEEPHLIFSVLSTQGDAVFERRFAGYELRARLRGIDGVAAILVSGGKIPEAQVELDLHKLAGRGIDPVELAGLFAAETRDLPAGSAREGDSEIQVISKGSIGDYRALSELIVPAASPLKISDIAAVREGRAPQKSVFVVNGVEQTAVEVYRRPGANPARLSAELKKLAAEVNTRFSRDIKVAIVFDAAPRVTSALHDLAIAMLISAAAVIAVLFLFIKNIRLSVLAALSIAVSVCAALVTLRAAGKSLNSMSLAGLSLGLGLVSDTALIITDALSRAFPPGSRKPSAEEAGVEAASLCASSFGGAATTAVVFIPILFLPGPLGALFGDLALAIAASVISGWLYAQFVLPSLFLAGFGKGRPRRSSAARARAAAGVSLCYERLLAFTFRRPVAALSAAALLCAAGIALTLARPALFISKDDAAELHAAVVFPSGTRAEFIARQGAALSGLLAAQDFFTVVSARAGAEKEDVQKRARENYQDEKLVIRAALKKGVFPEAARQRALSVLDSWKRAAALDVSMSVFFPVEPVEEILGLSSGPRFAVRGGSSAEAEHAARNAAEKLRSTGLFSEVRIEPDGMREEYRIYPRRERAALAGIDALGIARRAAQASEGFIAGSLETPSYPIDVRLRGGADGAASLAGLPVRAGENGVVTLGSLAAIAREKTWRALARLDRSDVRYLDAVQKDGEKPESVARKTAVLQKNIPQAVRVDRSAFSRYQSSLVLTFCLVLLLLYLTLGAQFESWTLPLAFLLSVPFAFAGVGPALTLARLPLDSGSAIALVALFGVVVNNGIVLYERAAAKRESGMSAQAAAREGASERLMPVLATTLTTTLVLIAPAAAALGAAQKTMAVTMLGGCLASTFITLFALPLVFSRFLRSRHE
jgi:multidrug efflux pump subunit AcrB